MFTRKSTSLLGVALLAAGAMFAAPAMAQDTNAPEQSAPSVTAPDPAPTDSGQADFSDDKLKSFAVAFLEVDKITKEYMPKLKEAASTEQQQEVRNEAGAKMVRAVEESDGISVDEYNQIVQTAQTNPDLANKLSRYIREAGE